MQRWSDVTICHVTAGDGYWRAELAYEHQWFPNGQDYLALGRQRWREARYAAHVVKAHPILLGFPDACALSVMQAKAPFTSPYTHVDHVPYADALHPDTPYTRDAMIAAFTAVIQSVRPDLILAPTHLDHNETHRATAEALREALPHVSPVPVWSYLVHAYLYPGWGLDWDRHLAPDPDSLPLPHRSVRLTRRHERIKYNAVGVHATQMAVLGPWLNAFVAQNEVFHPESEVSH